ncbi:MAG: hypothetical protein JNN28_20835 [Saprospiraceae bacterium]|nr:hypothetical protein [Saprospiraceae bacterium]
MNNHLLIAHRWKTLGWVLTIPALMLGLYCMVMEVNMDDYLKITLPQGLERMFWIDQIIFGNSDKPVTLSLLDELISIALLTGLLLLAFSKEKVEDEWIQRVRLDSLQWAVLINSILLIAFIVFTHGFPFFSVLVYNMFTPLLIFVARFYFILRIKPSFSKN